VHNVNASPEFIMKQAFIKRRSFVQRGAALSVALSSPMAWQTAWSQTAVPFEVWSETFAANWVRRSAEWATSSQYFSGDEQAAFERQLTPQTKQRREQTRDLAKTGLAQLAVYEGGKSLSAVQKLEAATLRWSLQSTLAAEPFEDHGFVFNQLGGPQVRIVNFMTQTHPLRNAADVQSYLVRLAQVAERLDESIARAKAAVVQGLLPPRFILERSRTQVQSFMRPAPLENDLVTALARRTETLDGLAPEARQKAISAAADEVRNSILPAYARVLAFLDNIAPNTNADAGWWRLPNGAAAYAQALANFTTTTLSADEIHTLGLREVARIEREMDAVLRKTGRLEGSVEVRMTALRLALQPPAEPDPRPALIAQFADMVRDNQRRSQALFNLQPKAPIEVRRVAALTEKTAAAHYTTPAPDGSRPGVFWAPLPGPIFNIPAMRSLTVHEAVPGHHFQLAIQQEQTDLPRWRQRRIFGGGSAHSEGWALYAERLAIDNGWYADDANALLGALDSQLFRARRLVVDTGLHAKKWTREQAIDYGISAQEVERYVSNPGQACAYMVGMLHILSLRDEAMKAQGAKFDIKAFHDVVLKTGSVPLEVLSEAVRGWTAAVRV
jgi:uncharacterized protein (DUF885 family)